MTAVSTVQKTTDPYLNGLLFGTKWAAGTLTYSFPASGSFYGSGYGSGEPTKYFEAFNSVQATQVRSILKMYSSVVNLNFVEVTESASTHGELRYAETDATGTAWAYLPSTSPLGGDAWFNNSKNYYDNPVKGNYAYLTMMHETGHALGLKHPHTSSGVFGVMPTDHDSLEYTVMSYRPYVGASTGGYTVANGSYPQTLMMDDIAALQYMYGAKYMTNSGDTVYRWDPTTGQTFINGVSQGALAANKVFLTIWDGGGNDTYDFSNYATGLKVSLVPGSWSTTSTTQLAMLGSGKYAAGNIANAKLYQNNPASLIENAIGGTAADTITGNTANNKFTGKGGNDVLNGGAGTDTAAYSGLKSNYSLTANSDGSWKITDLRSGSPDGTDTLKSIEIAQFADGTKAIGSLTTTSLLANSASIAASDSSSGTPNGLAKGQEWINSTHFAWGSATGDDADTIDTHHVSLAAQGTDHESWFFPNTGSIDVTNTISDASAFAPSVHGVEHGSMFEDQIPNPFGAAPDKGPIGINGFLALLAA